MAVASLPVARLLELRVTIAWQEAVAVVHAAGLLSAAEAIPITLEHCHISTAGDVRLSMEGHGQGSEAVSSLQLLEALLVGQASAADLRALVATADGTGSPLEGEGDARLWLDLRWCLGANPRADVARLADRGLAAALAAESAPTTERSERDTAEAPLVRTRPRVPIERARRRPAPIVRGKRLPRAAVLGVAAAILSVMGITAGARVAIVASVWPRWIGGGATLAKIAGPPATDETPSRPAGPIVEPDPGRPCPTPCASRLPWMRGARLR